MTINHVYIENLLAYGKYGKLINLIKNNIHVWSLNDFFDIFALCCGYYSTYINAFDASELCVMYFIDHAPDIIRDHIMSDDRDIKITIRGKLHSGIENLLKLLPYNFNSIRLFKNIRIPQHEQYTYYFAQKHYDILKYCVDKEINHIGSTNVYNIDSTTTLYGKYGSILWFHNQYMYDDNRGFCINIFSYCKQLIQLCVDKEYEICDKLYSELLISSTKKSGLRYNDVHFIVKYKQIWNIILQCFEYSTNNELSASRKKLAKIIDEHNMCYYDIVRFCEIFNKYVRCHRNNDNIIKNILSYKVHPDHINKIADIE
jgi:hypothetical protein